MCGCKSTVGSNPTGTARAPEETRGSFHSMGSINEFEQSRINVRHSEHFVYTESDLFEGGQ